MTLYLCHNCSNLDSPSGEACRIEAPDDARVFFKYAVPCIPEGM